MDSKSVEPLLSVWLRVGLFGDYIVEDVNEPFLDMVGMKKDEILEKSLLKSALFTAKKGKNLSSVILKTALDFVKTYQCRKTIDKFYHTVVTPTGKFREFFWEIACHPIRKEGEKLRIRIDIKNLTGFDQNGRREDAASVDNEN